MFVQQAQFAAGKSSERFTSHRAGAFPLTMASDGHTVTVCSIRGKDEVRRFLESLGFVEGTKVTVVTETGGNLIVRILDTRIAVSKSMSTRIMVTPD